MDTIKLLPYRCKTTLTAIARHERIKRFEATGYGTILYSQDTIALPTSLSAVNTQCGLFDNDKPLASKSGKPAEKPQQLTMAEKPQQLTMFADKAPVQFGVTKAQPTMPIPADCTMRLELQSEDPRTQQQKATDLQREAEARTIPLRLQDKPVNTGVAVKEISFKCLPSTSESFRQSSDKMAARVQYNNWCTANGVRNRTLRNHYPAAEMSAKERYTLAYRYARERGGNVDTSHRIELAAWQCYADRFKHPQQTNPMLWGGLLPTYDVDPMDVQFNKLRSCDRAFQKDRIFWSYYASTNFNLSRNRKSMSKVK